MRKLLRKMPLLALCVLAGCSSKDDEKYEERSLEELYHKGREHLFKKEYHKAAKIFDEVERQHPYSDWAPQAQLMSAYAYYLEQEYDDAIGALDAFVQLHPAHADVPYAYYLQGLCYYERLSTMERDQKMTELAVESFQELTKRFPDSRYAKDAALKIDLLRDTMAAKELEVGRYYLEKKSYVAAMNRFKYVVEHYQTTAHIEEALHRLVECYMALGLMSEAQKVASYLGHNYPGSSWYADTYALVGRDNPRPETQESSSLDFLSPQKNQPQDSQPTAEEKEKAATTVLSPEGEEVPGPNLPDLEALEE